MKDWFVSAECLYDIIETRLTNVYIIHFLNIDYKFRFDSYIIVGGFNSKWRNSSVLCNLYAF